MAKTESVTALIAESIKVNKAILKELREQNRHLRVLESAINTSYIPADGADCSYMPYLDCSGTSYAGTSKY